MAAAGLLAQHGLVNDAVSRLYYYLLSNIRALLLTEGLEARSHEGALRLLGLHFVKPGLMDPHVSHTLAKLMKYREEADYNPGFIFPEKDYRELKDEVDRAVSQVGEYLGTKGY